jgi:hypothetical protein
MDRCTEQVSGKEVIRLGVVALLLLRQDGGRSCLRAFGSGTLSSRMLSCYEVTRHLCMYAVVYPVLFHICVYYARAMTMVVRSSFKARYVTFVMRYRGKVTNVIALHCAGFDTFN